MKGVDLISKTDLSRMNLYQKLSEIRKKVQVLKKNKAGFGYKYVDEATILANIRGMMDKLGISLIPEIAREKMDVTPHHYKKTKVLKNGETYEEHVNEVIVSGDMRWSWVNDADPNERITIDWFLVGQQNDASQSFGSALTYSSRYFLLKFFSIATEDDPDNFIKAQKEMEQKMEKEVLEGLLTEIDTLVRNNLNDKEKLMEIIKKHVQVKGKADTNYFAIKDSAIAANLLKELKNIYK